MTSKTATVEPAERVVRLLRQRRAEYGRQQYQMGVIAGLKAAEKIARDCTAFITEARIAAKRRKLEGKK